MTRVPGLDHFRHASSTRPKLLLIVPSPSKSHSWLRPTWGLEMHTVNDPCFTSSNNLGTKIPHFKVFLVLVIFILFALSHWFFYCLHECMNEWLNGSLLIWKITLKWGIPSCGMWGPEIRYKWDDSEEPATLRWRQSASPKLVKFYQTTRCHTPHIVRCGNVGSLTICVLDWLNALAMAASLAEPKTYWMKTWLSCLCPSHQRQRGSRNVNTLIHSFDPR